MKHNEEIRKLRRQIEDRLRKISGVEVQRIGCILGLGCTPNGHEYASKTCSRCGAVFCYACCGQTNVHEGGKHIADFMTCPVCGQDYYKGEKE